MGKCKLFTVCSLGLVCLFSLAAVAGDMPVKKAGWDQELVWQAPNPGAQSRLARDQEDEYMTFRYIYSADGGDNWSEIMHTGDHGMWTVDGEDTVHAWGTASYDFGAIVDMDNRLHFIAVLNAYNEDEGLNPSGRVNGVYDVRTDTEGNATYTLIAAEEGGTFTWSDVGMDGDGNLVAIWVRQVVPDEGDPFSDLWASRSEDGGDNWSDPVMLTDMLDPTHNYPHITPHIGEFFYVLFEVPNVETGAFDHYVLKGNADLTGEFEVQDPGELASSVYFSYYVGSVNAIDQDVAEGFVYLSVRNLNNSATAVSHSTGDGNWVTEEIAGAQRYPGVMMAPNAEEGGTPFVFSNFGVPQAGQYHFDWFSFDGLGYNGGDWMGQIPVDSVLWNGTRSLLYCNQGVLTTEGRLVKGTNVWGQFTPEGFIVNTSDDMGSSWGGPRMLWSIFNEETPFRGGYIAQNHILAGPDNYVWIAFNGQYGETDFAPPIIEDVMLSSFNLGEPWVVSANISDELSAVVYADINWLLVEEGSEWQYQEADSGMVDENGYGTYYFTIPSDSMNGRALVDGDSIWFFVFAQDESGNSGATWESLIIVGSEWQGVKDVPVVPVQLELGQNYPNPFNSETLIPFSLDRLSDVKLAIYDISGRLITTLYEGPVGAGTHTVSWKADNVPTGIYFYALEASGQRHIAKLTLLR